MPAVLIIDDEPNVRYSLQRGLTSESLRVMEAGTARQGIGMVEQNRPDAVILDVRLPDMSGLDAFDRIRQLDSRLPVVIITAHAATETAIEAMKRGAFEFLVKPVDVHQLRRVVGEAVRVSLLSHVPAVCDQDAATDAAVDCIVGLSPAMQQVYKSIGRVAPQDVNVLILGESGTGKELVARAIYTHSRRNRRQFLALNCAAIPEGLLESELFGHERGSFTGADRRRIGKFEQAGGGTVFLDEIGDMTIATQSKILRLLQEGEFQRVGGNETLRADVRVIAATNRNLKERIRAGTFREDLYYRLSVFAICLPPLRDRKDDIPRLVEHFARLFGPELGKPIRGIPAETIELLMAYDWPGNVRELQSAVKYALVQATGEVLAPHFLPQTVRALEQPGDALPQLDPHRLVLRIREQLAAGQNDIYRQAQLEFDCLVFGEVLRHTHGNQALASQLLGISRTTLRAKLAMLGMLDMDSFRAAESSPPPHALP